MVAYFNEKCDFHILYDKFFTLKDVATQQELSEFMRVYYFGKCKLMDFEEILRFFF